MLKSLETNDDKQIVTFFWNNEFLFINDEWKNEVKLLRKEANVSRAMCFMWIYKLKSIESLICLFNLIFIIAGCVVVLLGSYFQIIMSVYFDLIFSSDQMADFFLSSKATILFGTLLIIYSTLAILSSCQPDKNRSRHCWFAFIMGLILVTEIILVMMLFICKDRIFITINNSMMKSVNGIKQLKTENVTAITNGWDYIQRDFKCCGITNFDTWKMDDKSLLPKSCCYQNDLWNCDTDSNQVWKIGCLEVVSDFVMQKTFVACLIGTAIVMIQMIDVISAFCLVIRFKNHAIYQKAPLVSHWWISHEMQKWIFNMIFIFWLSSKFDEYKQ